MDDRHAPLTFTLKVEKFPSVDGLYFITSPDVKGLLVSKMTLRDALADVPRAIWELAEARTGSPTQPSRAIGGTDE